MGPKITVDSATLVNKGLEVIEAHWLFGLGADEIEVVVHPQSIVHSLVEYVDGTQLAQLSLPDMKGPIGFALTYPEGRVGNVMARLDLRRVGSLEFLELDNLRFPAVTLARGALRAGGAAPAVLNFANEIAVEAFLNGQLPFGKIVPLLEEALGKYAGLKYESLADLEALAGELNEELKVSVQRGSLRTGALSGREQRG